MLDVARLINPRTWSRAGISAFAGMTVFGVSSLFFVACSDDAGEDPVGFSSKSNQSLDPNQIQEDIDGLRADFPMKIIDKGSKKIYLWDFDSLDTGEELARTLFKVINLLIDSAKLEMTQHSPELLAAFYVLNNLLSGKGSVWLA